MLNRKFLPHKTGYTMRTYYKLLHGLGLILADGEVRLSVKHLGHDPMATLDLTLNRVALQHHYLLTNFKREYY